MIILIDAYNILKRIHACIHISDAQRRQFEKKLQRYTSVKPHDIVLIFDGGNASWPMKQKVGRITEVYVGHGRTADDYIKEYMHHERSREMLLVSSDRELCLNADQLGIPSIDSSMFYHIVTKEPASKKEPPRSQVIKTAQETTQEIDSLMHQAAEGISYAKDDVLPESLQAFNSRTPGKSEKKLRNLLHKL